MAQRLCCRVSGLAQFAGWVYAMYTCVQMAYAIRLKAIESYG